MPMQQPAAMAVLLAALLAVAGFSAVSATSTQLLDSGAHGRALLGDHKYKKGDEIILYANKVGPFQNPT